MSSIVAKKHFNGYKVINSCLYSANETNKAVEQLELMRVGQRRIRIFDAAGNYQEGYVRHEIIDPDGFRVPRIFFRKISKVGKKLISPIIRIEYSNAYFRPSPIWAK
jgi:hypothetical protein